MSDSPNNGRDNTRSPESILKMRTRAVGLLTGLLALVVVVSFAWYALVTAPRYGKVVQVDTQTQQAESASGEAAPDPVQGA